MDNKRKELENKNDVSTSKHEKRNMQIKTSRMSQYCTDTEEIQLSNMK
jgi:hypothetical protein